MGWGGIGGLRKKTKVKKENGGQRVAPNRERELSFQSPGIEDRGETERCSVFISLALRLQLVFCFKVSGFLALGLLLCFASCCDVLSTVLFCCLLVVLLLWLLPSVLLLTGFFSSFCFSSPL